MNFIDIILDTPIWVWLLFLFLLLRGLKALGDREMRISRLFLLPILFLIWAIYDVITGIDLIPLALLCMGAGLLIGYGVGWLVWRNSPRLIVKPNSDLIIRPGTPLTLIFILVAFFIKFTLTFMVTVHSGLRLDTHFNIIFGLLSGITDGIFWGGTLNLFLKSK